jgi:hypothetical protein
MLPITIVTAVQNPIVREGAGIESPIPNRESRIANRESLIPNRESTLIVQMAKSMIRQFVPATEASTI